MILLPVVATLPLIGIGVVIQLSLGYEANPGEFEKLTLLIFLIPFIEEACAGRSVGKRAGRVRIVRTPRAIVAALPIRACVKWGGLLSPSIIAIFLSGSVAPPSFVNVIAWMLTLWPVAWIALLAFNAYSDQGWLDRLLGTKLISTRDPEDGQRGFEVAPPKPADPH